MSFKNFGKWIDGCRKNRIQTIGWNGTLTIQATLEDWPGDWHRAPRRIHLQPLVKEIYRRNQQLQLPDHQNPPHLRGETRGSPKKAKHSQGLAWSTHKIRWRCLTQGVSPFTKTKPGLFREPLKNLLIETAVKVHPKIQIQDFDIAGVLRQWLKSWGEQFRAITIILTKA